MATVENPTGAVLAVWQLRAWVGACRVSDSGCLTWHDLQSRDPEMAASFYVPGLFGWEREPVEADSKLVYVSTKDASSQNGGIMTTAEQHGGAPPYWLVYFTVSSCDGAVAQVRGLVGEVLAGPSEVSAGWVAVLRDHQGAAFALFEGKTDD